MPKQDEINTERSGALITSLDDLLSALPGEDERGDATFREQPVDLATWLYDERYMNLSMPLSPIQFEFLEAMDCIDPNINIYTEFVAEWGKGGGKDFICALAPLRQVYLLLCLRDPYTYHKLARGTGIQLINVAYTREQAQEVYLGQLKGLLGNSPWFLNRAPKIIRTRVYFEMGIQIASLSADGDSAEGNNVFFAVMDEASAFQSEKVVKAKKREDGVKADRAADAIYEVLRSSSTSRFPELGKVVMISYPRYRDDFIQQKRKENEGRPNGFVSGPYATWEVNPTKVKAQFAEEYARDPEKAAAKYECKPPYAEDGYIKYPHRFIDCVRHSSKIPELKSPIDSDGNYDTFFQGAPNAFYAIHVDLAYRRDRCALALARQGEPVTRLKCTCNAFNFLGVDVCQSCGSPQSRWVKVDLPTMVVTLLKEFKPRASSGGSVEVDLSDSREEILWLRERGHRIWSLTYDGWQSVDTVQIMGKILGRRKVKDRWGEEIKEEDIVKTLSVDKNMEAHDTLKEFIYEGRFFITPPPDVKKVEDWETSEDPVAIAFREWRTLRIINAKKIDHPIGGSKDFVDALAGVAYAVARMPIRRYREPGISGWTEKPLATGGNKHPAVR